MRINNKRIIPFVETIYTILFLCLLAAVLLFLFPFFPITKHIPAWAILLITIAALYFFIRLGHQHFEYDSDGEVLNFRTKDCFFSKHFDKKNKFIDFPKDKLHSYKFKRRYLFKLNLEVYVRSRRASSGKVKQTFNVTYLSRKEIEDLKISLNRVLSRNTKNKEIESVKQI